MAAARGKDESAQPLLLPRPAQGGERWWRRWAREAGWVGYLALPMVVVNLSQYAVQVSSNMMVGHLPGVLPLSSAAIATSLANVSGFSVLIGMATALETLCGQAFGAKQYHKLGLDTYRAMVTLLVVCIPLSLLWVFMDKILVLIGQDPLIAQGAGRYMIWLIPGLFANAAIQPLTKFLQMQSLIYPLLLSSVATTAIHIPLCYVMVFKTGLGYRGAALTISISYWLNVAMLVGYIMFSSSCKETRTRPTVEVFRGVDAFLRLALPSALMMCLEWWSFELLILLSGFLPNPELQTSVLSICLTSVTLLFTIPFGLGAAGSTRVANELGARNPDGARSAVRVVLSMAGIDAVLVSGSLLAVRRLVGIAYSSEEEVISLVATLVPLVCITVITDCIQGVLGGNSDLPLVTRHRPWVRVAAPGRVREPRLLLPAGDPDGDPPRLRAGHGVEGALDGHRLRLPVADRAHVRHHLLHRLAQDGCECQREGVQRAATGARAVMSTGLAAALHFQSGFAVGGVWAFLIPVGCGGFHGGKWILAHSYD